MGKLKIFISKLTFFLLGFIVFPTISFAHSGGLDAHGCHIRRATGEYHCHRPQGNFTSGKIRKKGERGLNYYKSREDGEGIYFRPKISNSDSECACVRNRVCIGPRGGHYCINGSGNKRYLRH